MKILIIGSQGFIGNTLIKKLVDNNIIIGVDKVNNLNNNIIYYNIDCSTQKDTLSNILITEKPDVILNCAAIVGVDDVKCNCLNVGYNNFMISYNLCNSLLLNYTKAYQPLIIFFSSSEVYGNTINASPVNNLYELHVSDKRSSYSISKLLEENLYNNLREYYNNIKILRLFNIVGELQSINFVIPKMLSDIMCSNIVTISQTYRCFCYVDFLVSTIIKVIYYYTKNINTFPDVTNFTSYRNENYISMFKLYTLCKEVTGIRHNKFTIVDTEPSDIIYRKSEKPKIPEIYLDYSTDISIKEIIKKIYEYKKF